VDADILAGRDLVFYIDLRCRISADQDDGQPRPHAVLLLQTLDAQLLFRSDAGGNGLAVDDSCAHSVPAAAR
jgi:hypothetical protein